MRIIPHCTGLVLMSVLFAPAALAQSSASAAEKATAEAMFESGVELMRQNSFKEACPKLEMSQRIEPTVGTLLYLGECYERLGRTASAWVTFKTFGFMPLTVVFALAQTPVIMKHESKETQEEEPI